MMMRMSTLRAFGAFLCCFAASVCAAAGSLFFSHLDTRNGLSQNTVRSIVQDQQGFMWFATKDGLNRYDGVTFRTFKRTNSGLGDNYINALWIDKPGRLWIGTEHGAFVYDPSTECITPLAATVAGGERGLQGAVCGFAADAQGNVYIATELEGLMRLDASEGVLRPAFDALRGMAVRHLACIDGVMWIGVASDDLYYVEGADARLQPFTDDEGQRPFRYADANGLAVAGKEAFVATNKGLYAFNLVSHKTRLLQQGFFRTVCLSSDGRTLWAGSEAGIYLYNIYDGVITHVSQPNLDDPFALSDNAIYALCTDHEGGMWVGSYFGGINYLPARQMNFQNFYPRQGQTFMGHRVREFCQDARGIVWIGTEDKGLLRYNPDDGSLQPVPTHMASYNIHGLCVDDDTLWVGSFEGGLERISLSSGSHKVYFADGRPGSILSNFIISICRAVDGTIWMATTVGLMRYDRASDSFARDEHLPPQFVQHIIQTHDGILWLATYADGLYCYNTRTEEVTHYAYDGGREGTIGGSKVISLFEDSRHELWVMTHEGGLSKLDRKTGRFTTYVLDDEGRCDLVYRMVEDRQGNLWCSTNNGLIRFNPRTNARIVYTTDNGLHSDHFNYQSGIIDRQGYIYFGTINGFVRFHPAQTRTEKTEHRIALVALYVANQLQQPQADGSPLNVSIDQTDELRLRQNSFAIAPRLLNYSNSGTMLLHYRLDDYDREWQPLTPGQANIAYTHLPYGRYTLHIAAVNDDGSQTLAERTLDIDILPPFYLTTAAKLIYALLAVALLTLLWRYFHRKQQRRMLRDRHLMEQQKERELYDSKIAFFTTIAHEIRTPLTLIKTPLESILRHHDLDDNLRQDLEVMALNTQRLINLVGQLLDFRKVESRTLQLHPQLLCLSEALTSLVQVFRPAIAQRGLQLRTDIAPSVNLVADRDLVGKMVANLMSNALKYAATYIELHLTADDTNATITTVNDGDIVPLDRRESIFQPFVRYTSAPETAATTVTGTGIGLSLLRTMAEQHHGTVGMDRDETVNRFILTLPLRALQPETTAATDSDTARHDAADTDTAPLQPQAPVKSTLLIVEDNVDLRQFLARHFAGSYRILEAADGEEALVQLQQHSVGIIVSDIMMPHKDGIVLLQEVKQNVEYSHIPVVLLTAKTTIEDRLAGLRQGADAYIDKPFDMALLEQTLQTLLQNLQRLYTSFTQRPFALAAPSNAVSEIEEEFIQKLSDTVMKNIDNPDYGIDQLAEAMNMSRSSLNRKIRGALNMTPNDYIRVERLKRAAALLKTGRYKINEVCYMVGFNTPSYFAKCFQRQYGMLPKDVLD